MANVVQFIIDDTSPSISYEPFGDTLSFPDILAGWNPFFSESGFAGAQGVKGNGTSLHVTSRDGAKLTMNWTGTTVQLQGNVTDASYAVELDGQVIDNHGADLSQNVLATFQNLPNTPHTVSITAQIPNDQRTQSSLVTFDQAIIVSRPPNLEPSTPNNVYLISSLNPQSIAFNGRWSFVSEGNINRHLSQSPGDRATARFRGTGILLRGTTSPESGRYSVTLNNQTTILSARSSFLAHDRLLYYATALEPNATHTITIANEGEGQLALLEGGFRVYAVGSPDFDPTVVPPVIIQTPSSLPKATIAALVLGAVLGCILISALLYLFCIYRPRRKLDKERNTWRQHVAQSTHSHTDPQHPKAVEAYPSILDTTQQPPSERRQAIADVDIEPHLGVDRLPCQMDHDMRRDSSRSRRTGFLRWKREVETFVARESLGIEFTHSPEKPSPRQGSTTDTDSSPLSGTSRSLSSIAFRASRMVRTPFQIWGRSNNTGTSSSSDEVIQQQGERYSWSPSYQINLPFQLPVVRRNVDNSGLGPQFYPAAPPSYAASVLSNVGNRTPPSLPQSVGQDLTPPANAANASPESGHQSDRHLSVPNQPTGVRTSPDLTPPILLRKFSKEDRGSVHDQSGDEDPRILGTSSERHVLRSLSPRTSRSTPSPPKRKKESSPPSSALPVEGAKEREVQVAVVAVLPPPLPSPNAQARLSLAQVQHQARPLPPVPCSPTYLPRPSEESQASLPNQGKEPVVDSQNTTRPLPIPEVVIQSVPHPPSPKSQSAVAESIPPSTSPIRAGSGRYSTSPLSPRGARPPPVSLLRRPSDSTRRLSLLRFAPDAEQRRAFRLTPPVNFIPFPSARPQRRPSTDTSTTIASGTSEAVANDHQRYSYIDFTSSASNSLLSRNPSTSGSDGRRFSTGSVIPLPLSPPPPVPEERSRWSSSNSGAEGASVAFARSMAGSGFESSEAQKKLSDPASTSFSGSSSFPQKSRPTTRSTPAALPQLLIPSNTQFIPHQTRLSTSGISTASSTGALHVHPRISITDSPSISDSPPISPGTVEFRYATSSDDALPGSSNWRRGRNGRRWSVGRQRVSLIGQMSPFEAIPPSPPSSELQHEGGGSEGEVDVVGPLPTGLSSPNYIVQRVLGLTSPVPLTAPAMGYGWSLRQAQEQADRGEPSDAHRSAQARDQLAQQSPSQAQHTRSRSASTLALLTSSLTSRFPRGGGGSDPDAGHTL